MPSGFLADSSLSFYFVGWPLGNSIHPWVEVYIYIYIYMKYSRVDSRLKGQGFEGADASLTLRQVR